MGLSNRKSKIQDNGHDPFCACDDCFDKPAPPKTENRGGKRGVSHLDGKGKGYIADIKPPMTDASPLNEKIRDDVKHFMGRMLSEDECKIIDIVIMKLTVYERTRRSGVTKIVEKKEI